MADDPDQLADGPGLSDLAGKIADEQLQPERLQKQEQHARNTRLSQQKDLDRYSFEVATEWFIEEVARRIINATSVPESVLNPLARGAIDSLLGDGPPSGRAGNDAGNRLIRKVAPAGDSMQPGTAGAAAYLTLFLNESIEAWFRGVVVEFITEYMPKVAGIGGGIETVQRLQDVIEGALGGSRMVRRVLQPFIQATAITPAQWDVNKRYRPALLSIADAVRQYHRGRLTLEALTEELARQGWSNDRIEALINGQRKFFGPADVRQFVTREHWTHDQGRQHLQDQGYTQEEALDALRLEGLRRFEALEAQEGAAIIAAYVAGDITRSEMSTFMDRAVTNPTERNLLLELAELRAGLSRKFLSPADERRLVFAGIRNVSDFRRALEREGYVPEAVTALELELRAEIAARRADADLKAEQAAAREAEKAAAAEERAARLAANVAERALPSLAEIRKAYTRGHVAIDRLAAAIEAAHPGITPEDRAALLAEAEADRANVLEAQAKRTAAEEKERDAVLSIGQLESAVIRGILSLEDYAAELRTKGYDEREVNAIAGVLRAEIEDRQEAAARRAEAAARAAARGVSLDSFERAVRLGVRSIDQYAAYLQAIDTPDVARALILDVLRVELERDAEARAKRQAAAEAAATKGISLDRRRRAVLLGVDTFESYVRALEDAKLSEDDRRIELGLLEVELAEAEAARARREEIAAELEARQASEEAARAAQEAAGVAITPGSELSLSQIERAVKLQLLPPEALLEHAIAKGYSQDDAELLVSLAVFGIPDLRDGARRREEIQTELAARQIALADLERAVLRGLRTLEEFAGELAARGYGPDDVALLTQLLAERLGVDLVGLRKKIGAVLDKAEEAPTIDAFAAALLAGEISAEAAIAVLERAGVARDTALVFVRLMLTTGGEG